MCRVALLCIFSVCTLHAAPDSSPVTGPVMAPPVTVLLDFEQPHSSASFAALQQELDRILAPARLHIDLRDKSDVPPYAQFGDLLIFKMKGACSMTSLPIGALSDERGPLAMTYSADGQMLSFGEVECDRVRQCLQRVFGRGNPHAHEAAFGIALARVMAHEMYHMMGNCADHTRHGVTKRSLSGQELSQQRLPLGSEASEAFHNASR